MISRRLQHSFERSERMRQEPVGLETDLLRRRESGPYPAVFSLHSTTMRLKTDRICPRSPTRLATIAQVRQAPSGGIDVEVDRTLVEATAGSDWCTSPTPRSSCPRPTGAPVGGSSDADRAASCRVRRHGTGTLRSRTGATRAGRHRCDRIALGHRSKFDPQTSERSFGIGMTDISQLVLLPGLMCRRRSETGAK